jgi:ABC-type nickel/cobalt efflux system permease component RcnA
MNERRSIRRRGLRPILLLGLIALLLGLLAPPQAALAHPADMYLQATYITVAPSQIVVELDLTPGVLVAPQVLPQLDTDGNQQISDAEGQAYVDAMLRNVVLQVDGKPLALVVTKIDMPAYLNIQAGYGTIRIFTVATLAAGTTGTHQIFYKNNFAPTGSAYQVNAFVDKGVAITLGKQNRDSIQHSMTMDYAIGSAAPGAAVPAATAATSTTAATTGTAHLDTPIGTPAGASEQARQLLAYLYEPALSPWVLLLGLALAGVLGGLHALTPGHGKTLVAAYLVGSRGTVRHAVALGAIVTFTHTASVIVIGLLALFASQFVVPNVLVPILEILSGLLVVFMGARLVWQRWNAFHSRRSPDQDHAHNHSHSHDHGHTHDHSHSHDHDGDHTHASTHDHGDGHTHSHLPPAEGIKLGSLVAMGVSGGLVPCPEALGIMVIAIGLNRILLGLGLIVSFSFGLAAMLIVIGILLVRSRSLVERFGGISSRWSSALPLCSAVIVTVLGVGITLSGLASYLG